MDDLDRKILSLLAKNARMPVKEIAEQVAARQTVSMWTRSSACPSHPAIGTSWWS